MTLCWDEPFLNMVSRALVRVTSSGGGASWGAPAKARACEPLVSRGDARAGARLVCVGTAGARLCGECKHGRWPDSARVLVQADGARGERLRWSRVWLARAQGWLRECCGSRSRRAACLCC